MEIHLQKLTIKPSGFDAITIAGQSVAGQRTCLVIDKLSLCFDIGVCFDVAIPQQYIFVSHGHIDHIGGLITHSLSRKILKMSRPNYYMPAEAISNFKIAHDALKSLNRHVNDNPTDPPSYILEPIDFGIEYNMKAGFFFKIYQTIHGVESQAYCVFKNIKKLKEEYKDLSSQDIGAIKRSGVDVVNTSTLNLIAFTGDTTIEGVLNHNDLLESKILIMECTYVKESDTDSSKADKATTRGHIHEQHIIDNYTKFHNEHIVLTHISSRHSPKELDDMYHRLNAIFNKNGTTVHIFDPRCGAML